MRERAKRRIAAFALLGLALHAAASAADDYTGVWSMTSMSLDVKVTSWSDLCGPRPASYSSQKPLPMQITASGTDLVFSRGNLRTDRCISPNPRLYKETQDSGPGRWRLTCKTAEGDPKAERGVYLLKAEGPDRLVFSSISDFDWTLKGEHCIARSEERRVFVRGGSKTEADKSGDTEDAGCANPGPAARIFVVPRQSRLGPGEEVCLRAVGIDRNGCSFPVSATWKAFQAGKPVDGIVTPRGCFRAGETAAETEGDFRVTARAQGKSDSAQVSVVFPDLGQLFAARLKPLEDLGGKQPAAEGAAPEADAGTATTARAPLPEAPTPVAAPLLKKLDRITGLLIAALIALLVLLALAIGLFIRRYRRDTRVSDPLDSWPDAPTGAMLAHSALNAPKAEREKRCPVCGKNYPPIAGFCPRDGAKLVDRSEVSKSPQTASPSKPPPGMVCPRCHRGYDQHARFCPHDAERLVPYEEWRKTKRQG